MFRFKSLFYSLSVCFGIIFIASISSASAFAADKPEIFLQLGHSGWVQTVDMSRDGKYLLSGGWGGAVKLWDVQTGREIRTLLGHKFAPSVAFSPDGRHAVSFDSEIIKLWDLQSGHEIYTVTKKVLLSGMFPFSFLSNGKYFMISDTFFTKSIHIWETATGREIGGLNLEDRLAEVIVSPDGRFALTQQQSHIDESPICN